MSIDTLALRAGEEPGDNWTGGRREAPGSSPPPAFGLAPDRR